jgi:hypothetical protein
MKSARHGLIAILFSILVLPLTAVAAPLNELIAGASITTGGMMFSRFSGDLSGVGAGNAGPENLSQVEVSGFGNGLVFSANFFAARSSDLGAEAFMSLDVGFDVTVLAPPRRIHDIFWGTSATFQGLGLSCVAASVFAPVDVTTVTCDHVDGDFPLVVVPPTASQPFSSATPSTSRHGSNSVRRRLSAATASQ